MRRNLSVDDLGDLLDQPLIAVLATLRADGTVLLSPVWHEWRDDGFNVWAEEENVKARHLRRDRRTTILVADFSDEYGPQQPGEHSPQQPGGHSPR